MHLPQITRKNVITDTESHIQTGVFIGSAEGKSLRSSETLSTESSSCSHLSKTKRNYLQIPVCPKSQMLTFPIACLPTSLSPLKKNLQLISLTGLLMFLDVAMHINESVSFPLINLPIVSSFLYISEGRGEFPLVPAKTITISLYSWHLMDNL